MVLDLHDASFHLNINLIHRQCLQFAVGEDHFQFRVLATSTTGDPFPSHRQLAPGCGLKISSSDHQYHFKIAEHLGAPGEFQETQPT